MPDIKDSVGEGGRNDVHDVALLQAMLRVVKDAKNAPYLTSHYDGIYGNDTKNAILSFQKTQGLVGSVGGAGAEKEGLVTKGSVTLQKLKALLPASHKEMMIIDNTRTVYLPGSDADAQASEAAVRGTINFDHIFKVNVAQLVKQMYDTHKIVLWMTPSGKHRTFAAQQALKPTTTKAGPGESNHNFGRAVDIGFKGLEWVAGDGAVVKDDWWLNQLGDGTVKANQLWHARDAIGVKQIGLFNGPAWDHPHLQAFDDNLVSMRRSLVALLNTVGTMNWQIHGKQYKCDLGHGGQMFAVGTAKEIWALKSSVTKAMIVQVRNDETKKAALLKGPAALAKWVPLKETDIKADEPVKLKNALKGDFELAEKHWQKWKPIP